MTDAEAGGGFGVQTFIFKQSSLPCALVVPAGLISGQLGGAMVAPNVAGAHATAGCGGRHRRSATGAAANGIPRNAHDEPRLTPWMSPMLVETRQEVCDIT